MKSEYVSLKFIDFASRRLHEGKDAYSIIKEWIGDDFEESEHPRNERGRFTKKSEGKAKREAETKREEKGSEESISPHEAKKYREKNEIPEGWYVHGRRGRDDLNTGHVIQLSRDWNVAEQYAGKEGSQWMVKTPSPEKTFDARNEVQCEELAEKLLSQYEDGELPTTEAEEYCERLFQNANGDRDVAVQLFKTDLNPENIVDSAGFWDAESGLLQWFYENTEKTFVITNNGAVMIPGDEEIETVKVADAAPEVDTMTVTLPVFPKSLNKRHVGTVDFLGEIVYVFTVNGQYTRSPTGADIIQFTMGGNWYGGTKKGTYHPVCEEDEVVLHELMPPVDILATLVHECVERYMMKEHGLSYDDAHSDFAEPAERKARLVLEDDDWSFDGTLDEQFQRLIERIAA